MTGEAWGKHWETGEVYAEKPLPLEPWLATEKWPTESWTQTYDFHIEPHDVDTLKIPLVSSHEGKLLVLLLLLMIITIITIIMIIITIIMIVLLLLLLIIIIIIIIIIVVVIIIIVIIIIIIIIIIIVVIIIIAVTSLFHSKNTIVVSMALAL